MAAAVVASALEKDTVDADDLGKQGYVRARKDGGKWKLHWAELRDRRMCWFSTQRPPEKPANASDLRHTIDLRFYRVGPGPADLQGMWAFSLTPSYNAPHGTTDYHFVLAMGDQLESWKELLGAATVRNTIFSVSPAQLGTKYSAARLVAGTVPRLDTTAEHGRVGFLSMKKQGADWRSWKLRWCMLDGDQLSWCKTPKIGNDNVKPIGTISIAGAKIHAGQASTAASKFFRVSPPASAGEEFLFAGESRKDTVEWVHLLQHAAGHVTLAAASAAVDVDSAVELAVPGSVEGSVAIKKRSVAVAKGVSKAGFVHFRRGKKRWRIKFCMLRKNQLHWFDPPSPESKKLSSEDAIILAEPFAIQGAPQHAPNGRCISIVTLSERYFFVGMTVAETEAWTRALQLVWHCLRPELPGAVDLELLHAAVRQYQSQLGQSTNEATELEGCMQWKSPRSSWQFVAVLLQGRAIQVHEPSDEPGAPGTRQASIALAGDCAVTDLPLGLYGFEVTTSGTNHAFALHSAEAAVEWVSAIRAIIGGTMTSVETSATVVQTNVDTDGLAELDELDDLDILGGGQLDGLAELEDLQDLQDLQDLDAATATAAAASTGNTSVLVTSRSSPASAPVASLSSPAPTPVAAPVQILQGKLEKRGEGKLAKWKKNFVILDTVELSLYDDADTKLGAFALANLKAVQMLEGQAEGSMIGFRLAFKQETTLTLRARTQREAAMWIKALSGAAVDNT